MINNHYRSMMTMILALIGGAYLLSLTIPSALPAYADSDLPPRETPTSLPPPIQKEKDSKEGHGAYIVLHLRPEETGLWTVVQWQDALGQWHDVEGWRGHLDPGAMKRWWVASRDFKQGPFRWLVFDRMGGQQLAVSASFDLPYEADQTVSVSVSLEE